MKYALTFKCVEPLVLPINYNKILQAALLNWLDNESVTAFLHNTGYEMNKRKYKLYTFSNIKGNYKFDKEKRQIEFLDDICIILSFYTDEYASLIAKNIQNKHPIRFGTSYAEFRECLLAVEEYQACIVDTFSPITVHSTFEKPDGTKKTYYYEPTEGDFSKMIRNNLIRKYQSYYQEDPTDMEFSIVPYNRKALRRIDTRYSGIIIRAWRGSYQLEGSEELIKMALLSGLGERNSAGFGCVLQRKGSF